MRRRIAAFAGGLATLWIVAASPLAHLDHHLLTGHMAQHMLLMMVAAPLILLGARSSRLLERRPPLAVCWLAGTLAVMVWHVPAIFELALNSPFWHVLEQASFFLAGTLFWWPVVRACYEPRTWPIPIYLFLATLPCDALSAFLVFCNRVVYRPYASGHGMFGLSPTEDQALAGALMWVAVTFVYLVPALFITARVVSGEGRRGAEIGIA